MLKPSVTLLLAILVTGCSTTTNKATHQTAENTQKNQPPKPNGTKEENTRILQFTDISPKWPKLGKGEHYLDSYTSLIIYADIDKINGIGGNEGGSENLYHREYETRNFFTRLWQERIHSNTLTLELTSPDYSATVPLAIMEYSSSREKGEEWYRMVALRKETFPLFLVKRSGQNSKISLKFNVHKSQQAESNAGALLKNTLNTLATVTPQISVVTTLNKHFQQASKEAIDKTLSANFTRALKEDAVRDVSLLEMTPGSNIQVTFRDTLSDMEFLPNEVSELKEIASWGVTFDYPRPSVFAAYRICPNTAREKAETDNATQSEAKEKTETAYTIQNGCKANRPAAIQAVYQEVKASEILDFSLAFGADDDKKFGSVNSYIKQQDWFTDFISEVGNSASVDANKFCRYVENAMIELNLNALDADLVLWAVKEQMALPIKALNAFKDTSQAPNCETEKDKADAEAKDLAKKQTVVS